MQDLPYELLEQVFIEATPDSVFACIFVCRRWSEIIRSSTTVLTGSLCKLSRRYHKESYIQNQHQDEYQFLEEIESKAIEGKNVLYELFQTEARQLFLGASFLLVPRLQKLENIKWIEDEKLRMILKQGMAKAVSYDKYGDPAMSLLVPQGDTIYEIFYALQKRTSILGVESEDYTAFLKHEEDIGGTVEDMQLNAIRKRVKHVMGQTDMSACADNVDERLLQSASPIAKMAVSHYPRYATIQEDGSITVLGNHKQIHLKQRLYTKGDQPLSIAVKSNGKVCVLLRNELVLIDPQSRWAHDSTKETVAGRAPIFRICLDKYEGPGKSAERIEFARGDSQVVLYPAYTPIHTHFTYSTEPPYYFKDGRLTTKPYFTMNKVYYWDIYSEDDRKYPKRAFTTRPQTGLPLDEDFARIIMTDDYIRIGQIVQTRHTSEYRHGRPTCIFSFLAIVCDSKTGQFMLATGRQERTSISCTHSIEPSEGLRCYEWKVVAVIEGIDEQYLQSLSQEQDARTTGFVVSPSPSLSVHQMKPRYISIAFACGKNLFVCSVNVVDLMTFGSSIVTSGDEVSLKEDGEQNGEGYVQVYRWQHLVLEEEVSVMVWFYNYILTVFCVTGIYQIDMRDAYLVN